jgi:hypothetical protein
MFKKVWRTSYAQIDLKNCTITLKDGGSNTLEVVIGEGNLTYQEKKTRQYFRDRGQLDTVRDGDEEPVDVRLDFTWEFLKGDSDTTIEDALKKRGGAAAWVSSSADACEPYAVDIEVKYNPPCSSVKNEVILLADFRWETLDHDMRGGTVSVTGKCNITEATVTRTAVSTNV